MSDTVKCLGKVQGIDNDIRIGFQECCYSREKMNQGCSGRAGGLKGKLIRKCEARRWGTERWINVVRVYNTFQDPGEDGCDGL